MQPPRASRFGTVASRKGTWQKPGMPQPTPQRPPKATTAGGALIAVSAIVGAVVGYLWDQPSLGFVLGLGVGAALAVAVWLGDRR